MSEDRLNHDALESERADGNQERLQGGVAKPDSTLDSKPAPTLSPRPTDSLVAKALSWDEVVGVPDAVGYGDLPYFQIRNAFS